MKSWDSFNLNSSFTFSIISTRSHLKPSIKPSKLPKAKLAQCLHLRDAAEKAMEAVWDVMRTSGCFENDSLAHELSFDINDQTSNCDLKISRGLDRQFGELHGISFSFSSFFIFVPIKNPDIPRLMIFVLRWIANLPLTIYHHFFSVLEIALAAPFKIEDLALIWPQCMSNKALKLSYNSAPSPAYFAIRKANIAFVAEYILYAMPGEEAYGKNDIVYACEGFLPLVLDRGLIQDEDSWKIFNELKVQVSAYPSGLTVDLCGSNLIAVLLSTCVKIYIQRLDQSGMEEANTRVLPNLFVETLSSYSGVQIAPDVEAAFEALASHTKAEVC